jgi:hypothetical protein
LDLSVAIGLRIEKTMESKDSNRASEETNPQTGWDAARLATFNQHRGLLFRSLIECVPKCGTEG